ncbi:MAG TPA: response regulator [Aliidongia sp.]|nr:response regulator [Aliidongia sp.]
MAEILLIDDMAGVRRAVGSMLKQAGHTVVAAENGTEGLKRLKERRFDLVITDMLMPELDGTEILRHLGSMQNRPRVIAISGGGAGLSADMALKTARITADAYLEKPFDKSDLTAAIEKLLAPSK